MLLVDLNVDCVDAFLNIIPREKLLALGESLLSLLDKSVCIPERESQNGLGQVAQRELIGSPRCSQSDSAEGRTVGRSDIKTEGIIPVA